MKKWDKAKVDCDLAQKKIIWNFDPPTSSSSKLQESHACAFGQPKSYQRGTEHNNVSCGTDSQRETS